MYKKIFRSMCFLSMVTMVLSTVFVMAACYTSITSNFTSELKAEAQAISVAIGEKSVDDMINTICANVTDKRITLIDKDGNVFFDNVEDFSKMGNHIVRPEIADAAATGTGSAARWSTTLGTRQFYYAIKLPNGSFLRVGDDFKGVYSMFFTVLAAVLFVTAMLYILTVIVAYRLTENIVDPIKNAANHGIFDDDEMYEEIKPFIKRISNQNKEILLQTEKLKMHKVQLQAIADNMNEGLIVLDNEGSILSINDFALSIFGMQEQSTKYRHYSVFAHYEQVYSGAKAALEGKKGNIPFVYDGKSYQIFYSCVCRKTEITGAVLLLFDVTELARSEEMRREFTANVSHELKTPLTSIHGYAQIINSGIAKPEDVSSFVQKIEKESSRLIILVDDIIRLSKLDEGEELECTDNDILSVAEEVADELRQKASDRDITINVDGTPSTVYINLGQLTQLVYNLCDNAIKYNKNGGNVYITVSDKKLTVSDTGIGIPKEYLERIFERFFRVDKSRSKKVDGTGLGLSIVKHIVLSNNAQINVESTVGKGTTFTVDF